MSALHRSVEFYRRIKNRFLETLSKSQMKATTDTYQKNELISKEKLCTLQEFVEMGRLTVGQKLIIGEIIVKPDCIDEIHSTNRENLHIGDCTLYHQPDDGCCEVGWDNNHPRMKKFVLEIHTW